MTKTAPNKITLLGNNNPQEINQHLSKTCMDTHNLRNHIVYINHDPFNSPLLGDYSIYKDVDIDYEIEKYINSYKHKEIYEKIYPQYQECYIVQHDTELRWSKYEEIAYAILPIFGAVLCTGVAYMSDYPHGELA